MIFNVISACIGILLFVLFLGTIIAWIKPIPLAIIVLGVLAALAVLFTDELARFADLLRR